MAVVKLNRAIQYRAYPTEAQAVLLAKTFGCVRFVWNRMLMDAQQFLNKRNLLAWIILLMTFTLTATAKLPIIRDSIVRVKRKLQKSSANCLV